MQELTYRVVWHPFMGGPDDRQTMDEGLTLAQAEATIRSLPVLPTLNGMNIGGSYLLEDEPPAIPESR